MFGGLDGARSLVVDGSVEGSDELQPTTGARAAAAAVPAAYRRSLRRPNVRFAPMRAP
jgi:hypothetical protein